MAKISFITFYDQYSAGIRIMSSILQEKGHLCSTIYFKLAYSSTIDSPRENPVAGESIKNWQLMEYVNSEEPWSKTEESLLIELLEKEAPDIIGISNRSPLDNQALPLLKKIKTRFPEKILIAGGWGPVLRPEHYLKAADYVVFGEGEFAIADIADAVENNTSFKGIENLVYLKDGKVTYNPVKFPTNNLDQFPLPDYTNNAIFCIDENKVRQYDPVTTFDPDTDIYPILIGRGCILKCSYCSEGQWSKLYKRHGDHTIRPHRIRSIDHIFKEMKLAKEKGYKWISILESHLVGPSSYMFEFFDRYKKEIDLPFTAYLNYQQISNKPELLDAAIEAGFSKGPIGIQHGSEEFCREYFNRNIPNKLLLEIAQKYTEKSIKVEYQLIAGIPFETDQTLDESFKFIGKLPMETGFVMVSRLQVHPYSPLEKLIKERGFQTQCPPNQWYFTALLYCLRAILSDEAFKEVRESSMAFMFNTKDTLPTILPDFHLMLAKVLMTRKITICEDWPLLRHVYTAYMKLLGNSPIVIWGTGEMYQRLKPSFSGASIAAFIQENPTQAAFENIMLKDPGFLQGTDYPVFICSKDKRRISDRIKKEFSHINLIP